MGPITYSADITIPRVWPLHTLQESRDLLKSRIAHHNTSRKNRLDAQRRLTLVEEQILQKTLAKKKR